MGQWKLKNITFSIILAICLYIRNVSGCTIVYDPEVPVGPILHSWIYDTFRGNFWQNQTSGIAGIQTSATSIGGYFSIGIVDSLYVLSTTENFDLYEEHETADTMLVTSTFRCTDGSTSRPFPVWINIKDTNNNPPIFQTPPGGFVFTVTAPLAPGVDITGCLYNITVRDIDLTTDKIIFELEENPYFEIEKEIFKSQATPKEFRAILRTKTFIRSIPEPITLTVSATDNDQTGDPPRTTTTTITIVGNPEFELPEEPVFSQTFYLADYTSDNRIVLTEPITLQSGYDELVKFDIKGDFSANFELESIPGHANQKSIRVVNQLEGDVLRQTNIHLIVTAERELTSGASATIVLRLPEDPTDRVIIRFSQNTYIGAIESTGLTVDSISLSSGYGEDIQFLLTGDFVHYFSISAYGNVLSLWLESPLPVAATKKSFIVLEIEARRERAVSGWTSVVIEIIRQEIAAPVFTQAYYRGAYNAESGLHFNQVISLSQGYDDTVDFSLDGEFGSLFNLIAFGPNLFRITNLAPISNELLHINRQFLFTVVATKPGVLVARSAVSIDVIKVSGCNVVFDPGVSQSPIQHSWILDTFRGNFWQNQTTGIASIQTSSPGSGGYYSIDIVDSRYVLSTTPNFDLYEEYEVDASTLISSTFRCTDGSTSSNFLVWVNVIDTNNNDPTFFEPPDGFVFTIAAPVPPGFEITGCFHDMIVRDIDLTTDKIIFEIEENPYFEIEKEILKSNATPKNFSAIIRTKSFIRSIPEPITLTVSATDHDQTGDPPRTTTTTITIVGNPEFELPEEPVFSQTFYLADYTSDNRVVLTEPITLQSGYDELVKFDIKGELSHHFELELIPDHANQRSIRVINQLEDDVLRLPNIHLIVTAERELTSGASATIVLRLPEIVPLEFETAYYEGTIENNNLRVPQLILNQGYEGATVTASVRNEHSSFFTAVVQGKNVTLSMKSLDESIINENSFLNLEVLATNGLSTAITIVTLKIIKDDNVTPVFNKAIYTGSYDPAGLTLEPIVLVQGYDGIDAVALYGEYKDYFNAERTETTVTVSVPELIPPELYSRERIVLSLEVTKPRTVGASAAIIINLPPIVPLEFETAYYEGTIENNNLHVPQLILSQGYDGANVTASVRNEHSSFFTAVVQGKNVTLSMKSLNESIINENSFLNLEVLATNGLSTAITIVTLKIIKDDNVTPVFNKAIYTGSYDLAGLTLEPVVLVQGYDGIDGVALYGEYKDYFKAERTGTTVTVSVPELIPPELYSRERIVLSLEVTKPRTVGASAAIIINLPPARELKFGASTYRGRFQDNVLTLDPIPLTVGFDSSVVFSITGDYEDYFQVSSGQNPVTITLKPDIPDGVLLENNIIILTLTASGPNAVTTTTSVLLDIIKDDTTTPVFSRNIYYGTYLSPSQVNIDDIKLSQGFDSSVTFRIDGDHADYFEIKENTGNNVTIVPRRSIPEEVIFKEKVLVFNVLAEKPLTVGSSAAISIQFPSDLTERAVMRFSQNTYTGAIESTTLTVDSISLSTGYEASTDFILTGDFREHFALTPNEDDGSVLSLSLDKPLPVAATENTFIVLEIEARRERAVSGWTSVVIEVIRQEIAAPVFTQAYYRGAYSAEAGLQFNQVISLSYGYDDTVDFSLDGEFGRLFTLDGIGTNSLSIKPLAPIPTDLLQANSQFLFTVVATKPGTLAARSAVSIDIEKDFTDQVIMKFSQTTYTGAIESTNLTVDSISLSSGYEAGTDFILTGDFREHFTLTPNEDDGSVLSLSLDKPLPVAATENTFIVLEIEARRERAVSGWTSVVIEVIRQEIAAPVFTQAYYRGAYSAEAGLQFNQVISLSYGYDDTVDFSLDGEFGRLFTLDGIGTNSLSIKPLALITNDLLQANSQFLFTVVATKPGTLAARSAVSIDIEKDLTDRVIMRFSQNTYTGAIESSTLTVDSISLSTGYEAGTDFILTGDFKEHFALTPNEDDGSVLSLSLDKPLPVAATENTFIVLEIEARRERAVSGWTSVVIEVIRQEIAAPVFTQAYYRGAYSAEAGLQFNQVISLSYGYDDTVDFSLDGEFGRLFTLDGSGTNSLSIKPLAPISTDLLQANSQFLFTVVATKPGTLAARAAVSIDIEKDLTDRVIMRFSQNTYTGAIESTNLTVDNISLSTGYEAGTDFILTGDFREHFALTPNEDDCSVLSLSLDKPLPVAATENTFIVLEIEARRERAVSGWTSVVIEVIRQEIAAPVFTQAYYRGAYSAEAGLQFNQVISLSYGYDDTVDFSLDGEFGRLFTLDGIGTNSLSIKPLAPISTDLLQANSQFLFTVVATKPGTLAARSAVSIDIEKDLTDRVIMRFSQNTYTGAIESTTLTVDSISLSTGYDAGTDFILTGDFKEHFALTPNEDDGSVLSLSLDKPLPVAATENTFIVLEIEARRERAVSGWTSVVIEVIRQEIAAPVFTQAYYRGAYSAEAGLQFNQVISLSYGYDDTVDFSLDGEFGRLFTLDGIGTNSLSIKPLAPISTDLLQANSQFLFTVVATKPGTLAARSAVSIDIEKDLTDRVIMRFSQNTYTGAIESTTLTVDSISLSTGYEAGTDFILTGDFKEHFALTPNEDDGSVLSLSLDKPLPVAATENTFIVLEIEARRERAVSGWTSVVIEVIRQEIAAPVFTQAYYRGAYSAEAGLQFNQVISLSYGYDDTVDFSLDGEFGRLFTLDGIGTNSLSIKPLAPISTDLLQANSQFLFTVVATKPGTLAARSAVSIDIEKDLTDRVIMRFSQNTYTGAIESTTLTVDSISLSTGYEAGTDFILTGDFKEHFALTPNEDDGSVLSLSLDKPLPVAATENTFIVLEIEARRERAVSGWTSVVIEVIRQEIAAPVFTQAYYRGAYSAEAGLQFNQVISLSYGYDDTVDFSLDGEFGRLFTLDGIGTNSLSIKPLAPISTDLLQANSQFLFTVVATKPGTLAARSAVSIDIEKDLTDRVIMRFSQNTYTGAIESTTLTVDSISLSTGYEAGTDFILTGDFKEHFALTPNEDDGSVLSLSLDKPLPVAATENTFIVLEIEARRERAVSGWTSVVIEVIRQEIAAPVFTQAYYRGAYSAEAGLQFNQVISLSYGYDDTVDFSLDGEFGRLFTLDGIGTNSLSIKPLAPIPTDLLQANSQFLFTVVATKPGTLAARSAVSIDIEKDLTDRVIMRFSQNTYTGVIESTNLKVDSISLSSGYEAGTDFILTGDFREHFALTPNEDNGSVLSLSLDKPLPVAATENTFIVLEIEARRERAVSGWTSVVIEVIRQEIAAPVFTQAYYRGAYSAEAGLQFNQVISLSYGYDDTVDFSLDGEFGRLFTLDGIGTNSLSIKPLAPISTDLLQANSQFLFTVVATKPGTLAARAAVSIDIEKDLTDRVIMRFSQNTYTGAIESTNLTVDNISLSTGYEAGTDFILTGDFREHFALTPNEDDGSVVALSLDKPLPVAATENTFIVLEIEARRERAVSGWTSVVMEVIRQEIAAPVFTQAYYRGAYSAEAGLQFNQVISLSYGYDDTVDFSLDGEFGRLFTLDGIGTNSLSIKPLAPISTDLLQANSQFLFTVVATKPGTLAARSAVSIDIEKDLQCGDGISFGRYLYQGVVDEDEVRHEPITLAGYDGTDVEILGLYAHLFEGLVSGGGVDVQAREAPLNLPSGVTTVPLELRAGKAGTALLLKVLEPDQPPTDPTDPTDPTEPTEPTNPTVPTVTFSSESYMVSVHMAQTGLVGRVSATADNGEDLTYSVGTDDAHLQSRLSINNEGALHLSAPANSGVYTFQVIATTVDTRATGSAVVHLTVQAVTECEDNGIAMNPLIIIDRDEEEPHNNLVVLDPTLHAGCHFTLTNRWPLDQTWLYVNENGLHTIPIDREHPSIAFMPLSQVQVELVLHCEGDKALREKRSERTERLGDYGNNKWVLTDSILFNSRRSLVNLIVNDINDNYPIFVGKENEIVTVGYPINELEERILPRSLAELKATDADIGENAMLRFWSSESVLAVSPTTGFVHVRTGARLQHDQLLTVTATDRNGEGLSTSIQLRVKLLDVDHIAVVTIRNAFLDDETLILARLTTAVGYEVKTLRSVVISDDIDEAVTRNQRETGTPSAALRLYVYGINDGEPVAVDLLTADINNHAATAGVVSTITLEDHLQDMSILDRQIGLLVATIVLSTLLFAMIMLVAIWFFLRWRKNKNYDKMDDGNSLASRNASLGELPKPEVVKPRLNIEELKKSEKRLQDMLQAPIEEVTVEPMPKRKAEVSVEPQTSILDLPLPDPGGPIVIQSIDKLKDAAESSDDEFGEVNAKPRKSVVTFNENVEKIIHVEDNADDDDSDDDASVSVSVDASNDGLEIYRL